MVASRRRTVWGTLAMMNFACAAQRTIDIHPALSRIYRTFVLSYAIMRSGLIVFLIASSFGLALAVESGPETAGKIAVGLARGAVVGVILGCNPWAPVPADVQSRLLLQHVVTDEGRESPRVQED
jgi:hypothetical protein